MLVRLLLIPAIAIVAAGFAAQAGRPRCNARNQGMMWPEEKARNACTELQVCALDVWKYRWESVTVHVSQLAKDAQRRSACQPAKTAASGASDAARSAQQLEKGGG